jgi:hypothetical protein
MPDLNDIRARLAEHNAVPAYLLTGPGQEARDVLVRVFTDSQGSLRIVMEGDGINQQLVLDAEAMRALPSEPPPIAGS